jgi:hypothetical protein
LEATILFSLMESASKMLSQLLSLTMIPMVFGQSQMLPTLQLDTQLITSLTEHPMMELLVPLLTSSLTLIPMMELLVPLLTTSLTLHPMMELSVLSPTTSLTLHPMMEEPWMQSLTISQLVVLQMMQMLRS